MDIYMFYFFRFFFIDDIFDDEKTTLFNIFSWMVGQYNRKRKVHGDEKVTITKSREKKNIQNKIKT